MTPFEPRPFGITEYDVAPGSAPLFLVGELWAKLHAKSIPLRPLSPADFRISPAGVAGLAPSTRLTSVGGFEPEEAAADLALALGGYSSRDAEALLAGYARGGMELIDRGRPGFTKALLEELLAPKPWPEPSAPPLSFAQILRALAIELRVIGNQPTLAVTGPSSSPLLWQHGLREAFLTILALLVAGVDCRALFERDTDPSRSTSAPDLYKLLWPRSGSVEQADLGGLIARTPEIELAIVLAETLRSERIAEPIVFDDVLSWVRKVLVVDAHQARLLGDVMGHIARQCASLVAANGALVDAQSYLQKAIILLEYTGHGHPSDERRLIALTSSLYDFPGYPKPFDCYSASLHLGVWNSLLLTYRELARKSLDYRTRGLTGLLRSPMIRGLCLARHQLRRAYETSTSRNPELSLAGHAFLRVTVKSYAALLVTLRESAEEEFKVTGESGWLSFFGTPQAPGRLAQEAHWISRFLEAADRDGFSLDVSRAFMHQGGRFLENEPSIPIGASQDQS